jgi:protoporphyrinogen oxidase
MSVAILGAGISGLTAARRLRERGVDVEVLEADSRAGGLCQSDVVDGYVMDRSGGHIVFSKSEKAMRYYHDLFQDEPLVESERKTRILLRGRYIPYPFENGLGELAPADRAACVDGAVQAQFERSSGAAKPSNFGDWIRWRVGEGIGRLFMEPYNRKIWKLDDLRAMGIDWVDGRVPEAPLSDVVQAALGKATVGYAHQAVFWYPRTGGFQAITDRIAKSVGDRVRLGVRVTDVDRADGRLRVNGRAYDAVISTIPLPILAPMVDGLDATTRAAAEGLGFVSLACFLFGIAGADAQPYSWLYLPEAEQGPANRVTYLSNYSPRNAPRGRASLLAEVTYRGKLDVTPEFVADLRARLAAQGLFKSENVSVVEWRDNKFAYIHFGPDFVARRAQAIAGLEAYGIVPLGRFGRYNYYNTDLCILEALEAADRLADRLTGTSA